MRRSTKGSSLKLSADSQRLASLAHAILQASSRLEERSWERSLDALLQKLLKTDHQNTIDAALDFLFVADVSTYDVLMESVEAVSSSARIERDDKHYDALLIAVPVLAWTRFVIASGPIAADHVMTLSAHLYGHVLAEDTRLAMAPTLFSIDQLPRTHAETYTMTQRMAQAALAGAALGPLVNPADTAPFLADTRYLLAVVVAAADAPFFRWQTSPTQLNVMAEREEALTQWRTQSIPSVERLLPGCGVELLAPEAYYVACREADRKVRPVSIHAAVHYLTHSLGIEATRLSVIIGNFGEELNNDRVDEYRISFTLLKKSEVIYGIVWPLYGPETAEEDTAIDEMPGTDPINEIMALLKECGVTDITHHDEHFPMEFCDDCGAPLFSDAEAELVHAEMPDDMPQTSGHLH
ncbi:MAG: DUF2863 family protein [Pseudomonadota bacterium]